MYQFGRGGASGQFTTVFVRINSIQFRHVPLKIQIHIIYNSIQYACITGKPHVITQAHSKWWLCKGIVANCRWITLYNCKFIPRPRPLHQNLSLSPVSIICHLANPLGLGRKNAQGQIHGQLGQPERPSASSSQLVADTVVWISCVYKLSMVNLSCSI